MNVACTFNGEAVNVTEIRPSERQGYLEVFYIDASSNLERQIFRTTDDVIATAVTAIDGAAV